MNATLIHPEWLIPVDPSGSVLTDHAVVLEGDRIVAVAPYESAKAQFGHATLIELPGHALIPGLVNLHTHASMSLMRGVGDDLPLQRWLSERIWPLEGRLVSQEFVHDGALLACTEMLLGGITCFNDMYFFPEQVIEAARAIGMRVVSGIIVLEFPSAYGTGPADYLRKGLEVRDRYLGDDRVGFTLSPHAPYTVSDDSFRRIAALAGELGLPVNCHVHETTSEIEDSLRQYGKRPLQRLADLGLVGPDLIAVHAVHLDEGDLDLLAEGGATVAHCPHSNLKLASGIAPTPAMLQRGINIGIGTDGSASNNRLDLFSEARTAALLAKGTSGDAACWPADQVLSAMTLHAARALGLAERIGSISVGKQADLVAVDLSGPDLQPVFDPISHLIHVVGRDRVSEVWVAGELVVSKRQPVAQGAAARVAEVTARCRLWHNRISEILTLGVGL